MRPRRMEPAMPLLCRDCRRWKNGRCAVDGTAQRVGHVCNRPTDFRKVVGR